MKFGKDDRKIAVMQPHIAAQVLEEFAAFWRQHGEFLVKGEVYHEVAPSSSSLPTSPGS